MSCFIFIPQFYLDLSIDFVYMLTVEGVVPQGTSGSLCLARNSQSKFSQWRQHRKHSHTFRKPFAKTLLFQFPLTKYCFLLYNRKEARSSISRKFTDINRSYGRKQPRMHSLKIACKAAEKGLKYDGKDGRCVKSVLPCRHSFFLVY